MSKDRLYESNDSREMEKCSISPPTLSFRVSVELRPDDRYFLGHSPFSSVGEGYIGWDKKIGLLAKALIVAKNMG